jgi:hypothetical protein
MEARQVADPKDIKGLYCLLVTSKRARGCGTGARLRSRLQDQTMRSVRPRKGQGALERERARMPATTVDTSKQ